MMARHWSCTAILCCAFAADAGAQTHAPDISGGALLRHVWSAVQDSLGGGGSREDQVLFAADSLSQLVFRAVEIPVRILDDTDLATCPGSSDTTGAPLAGPVGYRVHIGLTARADSTYVLGVSKSCRFIYRGSPPRLNSGFMEGMSWEVRRDRGVWRIGRRLSHVIT